jgi:hypothetical protein
VAKSSKEIKLKPVPQFATRVGSGNTEDGTNSEKESDKEDKRTPSEKAYTVKSKYFVSNLFVEKIFDTMNCTYA